MTFTKMHGIGNDVIVTDLRERSLEITPELARCLCDRRFGIGADQIMTIENSDRYDFRSRIINADGSEAQMCGNGIRCVALYVKDHLNGGNTTAFETLAGKIVTTVDDHDWVRVDMGEPATTHPHDWTGERINLSIKAAERDFLCTVVSMGNPHCVIFLAEDEDLTSFPLDRFGPALEHHDWFPNRANVEFVRRHSDTEFTMRVWERGAAETLACGTGACAVHVAAVLNGLAATESLVHLKGGDLRVSWEGRGKTVIMSGPAVEVFRGEWPDRSDC